MNKTISIVVPTYNMEGYLEKCLSSLITAQRPERVEVIVVNDGSKDSSPAIARGFAERHPDVFVVIDKPNGNYGSCINAALGVATGKYIKVCDADDYYDTAAFGEYVDLLESLHTDLVLNERVNMYSDRNEFEKLGYPAGKVFDFVSENSFRVFRDVPMHDVAYRLDMIKGMGYRQSEGIFYSDQEWAFMPMAYVRTAYYFAKPLYMYLRSREGQSVDPAVQDAHTGDEIKVTVKMIADYIRTAGCPEALRRLLYMRLRVRTSYFYKKILLRMTVMESSLLRPLDDALRDSLPEMYRRVGRDTKYGIGYVGLWRRNENSRTLRMLRTIYRRIKKA